MKQLAIVFLLFFLVACGAPKEQPAADAQAPVAESTDAIAGATEATDDAAVPAEGAEAAEATSAEPTATAPVAEKATEKPASYYVDKVVELRTDLGTIAIRFFPDVAPNHVKNFIDLSESGFYDGTRFHRIIPGFVIQGGDPNTKAGDPSTWGTGGSGRRLKAEFNAIPHKRGILSMARSMEPDSASSQFFVCVAPAPALDNQYTVFGEVVSGMDVVDKIVAGPRTGPRNDQAVNPVAIKSASVRAATASEKGPAPR
jgi:cyclophilin family peptidyl-prolyl cis-trans isomerase